MRPYQLASATPGGVVTLAGESNLRQGWDQGPGRLFSSGFGHSLAIMMAIAAACIGCFLAVALILKLKGSQSQLVVRMAGDGKTIFAVILLILVLVAPAFILPWSCSLIDLLINALSSIIQGI